MFAKLNRLLSPTPRAALRPPPTEPVEVDPDEPPCGCGWFDSSRELQSGLEILEHDTADAVAAALPLGDWLTLHLRGWQGPPCAA